jgi:hypothetical protein
MKKIIILLLVLPALITESCSSLHKTVGSKQTFTFDYIPTQTYKPGSASIVIAFIEPYYATKFTSGGTELFKRFKDAIGGDVEELIIAKGFTLKGPYAALDEMVYGDKKRIDMAIRIEIVPELTAIEGSWHQHISRRRSSNNSYSYSGKASLTGKINIMGVEPMTNEKILVKSVSIPNVENVKIESSGKYFSPLLGDDIFQDPGIYNAIGNALSEEYGKMMKKIAANFDPEDLSSYKDIVTELKARKAF